MCYSRTFLIRAVWNKIILQLKLPTILAVCCFALILPSSVLQESLVLSGIKKDLGWSSV